MVVLVVRGSGKAWVLTLRLYYARTSVETGRGYTKAPEGGRDKGIFRGPSDDQNMFKNSSRSFVRYPTVRGLRRSGQIFPRMYRVVLDSTRRFPTIFAKIRPIDQQKGTGSIGTKTILGKMAALLVSVSMTYMYE